VRDGNRRCDVVNLVQAKLKNRVWTSKEGTFSHFSVFFSPPHFHFASLGDLVLYLSFVRLVGACNSVMPSESCCHSQCPNWPTVFLVCVCVCVCVIAPY